MLSAAARRKHLGGAVACTCVCLSAFLCRFVFLPESISLLLLEWRGSDGQLGDPSPCLTPQVGVTILGGGALAPIQSWESRETQLVDLNLIVLRPPQTYSNSCLDLFSCLEHHPRGCDSNPTLPADICHVLGREFYFCR